MIAINKLGASKKKKMETAKALELLQTVRQQAEGLNRDERIKIDGLRKRLTMLIEKIFGINSSYISELAAISYRPIVVFSGMSDAVWINAFKNGKSSLLNLIDTMIEDIQLSAVEFSENKEQSHIATKQKQIINDRIFVVHGHNEEMKHSVARTIEQLNLKPIILHEQPNKGRTIIEKFADHSDVSFALVLLSADDYGYSKRQKPAEGKFRARQNVILELGFFIGKLGRQKVVALFESNENFEFPSDYQGVIFTPFDKEGKWKFDILRELKACGFDVDANKII